MATKLASIINYLISTGVFIYMIFFLRNKSVENSSMKFGGLSIKTLSILMYIGLAINIGLIVWQLLK
jgi:bacteriorhodopsin